MNQATTTLSAKVGDANLEKVWESRCREAYAANLNAIAPPKLETVVRGLEEYYVSKYKQSELSQCDGCFGWSPADITPECPYCGLGEDDAPAGTSTKTGGAKIDPINLEVTIAENVTISTADETTIDGKAIEDLGVNLEAPAEKKGRRKKMDKDEIAAKKAVKSPPPPPKPSAPVISILAGGRALASEQELDEEITKFRAAGKSATQNSYQMGVSLVRMREGLWQQRLEGGKPKYKSFAQFVTSELQISKSYADVLQNVVTNFSAEQFEKLGVSALKWIGAAPKEDRPMLLAMAEAGASKRDLEQEVAKIREQKGVLQVDRAATDAAVAAGRPVPSLAATTAAASARRRPTPAVTLGLKAEQGTIKLMARGKRGQQEAVARSLEESPYGIIECQNGYNLYLVVKQRPTGELEIKYTVKKRDEE